MKGILTILGICFLLFIIWISNRNNTYKQYIDIDGCIYLEDNIGQSYGDNNTKVLITCDSLESLKYKSKLNKKFDKPKGLL